MPDIDVAAAPQLSTIVFRHRPPALGGLADKGGDKDGDKDGDEAGLARHNAAIRAELFDDGRALVAATRVDGRSYLKLTLLNPIATSVPAGRRHSNACRIVSGRPTASIIHGTPPSESASTSSTTSDCAALKT